MKKFNLKINQKTIYTMATYFFLEKFILFAFFAPIISLVQNQLMMHSHQDFFSSGNFLSFIANPQGILFIILGLFLAILTLCFDGIGWIYLTKCCYTSKEVSIKDVFFEVFQNLPIFLKPQGLTIYLRYGILLPGLLATMSLPIHPYIPVPYFIKAFLAENPLLYYSYQATGCYLVIYFIYRMFFLPIVFLDKTSNKQASKQSKQLFQKHFKNILKKMLYKIVKYLICIGLVALPISTAVFLIGPIIQKSCFFYTFSYWVLIYFMVAVFLFSLFFFPLLAWLSTSIYLTLEDKRSEIENTRLDSKDVFVAILLIIIFICIQFLYVDHHLDRIHNKDVETHKIDLIAHRAGGNLGPENSIYGLKQAKKEGIKYAEVDIQRTKDHQYVIYHDSKLTNACHSKKKVTQVTLEDLDACAIRDFKHPSIPCEKIPTLAHLLDESKGSTKLFLELKGETADELMLKDVVEMVKDRHMEDQVVIISLHANLMKQAKQLYPEIQTGFIYYFSYGKLTDFPCDYYIMEEKLATPYAIDYIHHANKKAIVWTVNSSLRAKRYMHFGIDGIISDDVLKIKDAIIEYQEAPFYVKAFDFAVESVKFS